MQQRRWRGAGRGVEDKAFMKFWEDEGNVRKGNKVSEGVGGRKEEVAGLKLAKGREDTR